MPTPAAAQGAAAISGFTTDEQLALQLDAQDPLRSCRDLFEWPAALGKGGRPAVYLAGNSLGLMPKAARRAVTEEMDDWATLAVEGHLKGTRGWVSYHERFAEMGARLVGAKPGEVVMMNSLTVNLHLMMVSFFRPEGRRTRIVIEDHAFPSDWQAVASQLRAHGLDPRDHMVVFKARDGEDVIREEDVEDFLRREGDTVALVMFAGVNYLTGQLFDMKRIAAAARAAGAACGFDLAHAAGNVETHLHDWGVDFAVWCSYKYLNSGPGAVAGCFVHEKHWRAGADQSLRRYEGWWGHEPATRFDMRPMFTPARGADAWQLSNPPILSMAPLLESIQIFDRATMAALRRKSVQLTGYLQFLLDELVGTKAKVITPREPARRGAQLSVFVKDGQGTIDRLMAEGVVCDLRKPSVVRMAPAPLYCSFHDCWRAARALARALA